MILPPELIADVAAAVCRSGFGLTPGGLAQLADLTDLQILDFLCKPLDRPATSGKAAPAPAVEPKRPETEAENKALFFNIGRDLIASGQGRNAAGGPLTEQDLVDGWKRGRVKRGLPPEE